MGSWKTERQFLQIPNHKQQIPNSVNIQIFDLRVFTRILVPALIINGINPDIQITKHKIEERYMLSWYLGFSDLEIVWRLEFPIWNFIENGPPFETEQRFFVRSFTNTKYEHDLRSCIKFAIRNTKFALQLTGLTQLTILTKVTRTMSRVYRVACSVWRIAWSVLSIASSV